MMFLIKKRISAVEIQNLQYEIQIGELFKHTEREAKNEILDSIWDHLTSENLTKITYTRNHDGGVTIECTAQLSKPETILLEKELTWKNWISDLWRLIKWKNIKSIG